MPVQALAPAQSLTAGTVDEAVTDQFVRAVEKVMRDLGMRSGSCTREIEPFWLK